MKFIAVQNGARRGYAVPLILEGAGMLERFYTDLAGNIGAGRVLSALSVVPAVGTRFQRLASRQIPAEIAAKTRTFGRVQLGGLLRDTLGARDGASRFRRHLQLDERWGRAMIRAGFGEATHVFSMLGEGGSFLSEAHRRGLTVVNEVYIVLASENILRKERERLPEWEPAATDNDAVRKKHQREDVLLERSHYFVCPSEAVQDDLVNRCRVPRERTTLVPYGMHPRWLELAPQPRPGRVLFVGTAELRKGIHYLAMAAEQLHARGFRYEFRVAGNVSDQVRRQPVCRHLNFLGRVPRDHIHEEFQQADVFVLPSLAEGSAEVTYEALAAGVPLVVTPAAGSVARDGVEGRIVPERDPAALADAIEQVVEDRALRARLAQNARERALDFTWEKYGERLLAALRGFSR
jgi:glycosyltransferase involved in cell wall biosynthesis